MDQKTFNEFRWHDGSSGGIQNTIAHATDRLAIIGERLTALDGERTNRLLYADHEEIESRDKQAARLRIDTDQLRALITALQLELQKALERESRLRLDAMKEEVEDCFRQAVTFARGPYEGHARAILDGFVKPEVKGFALRAQYLIAENAHIARFGSENLPEVILLPYQILTDLKVVGKGDLHVTDSIRLPSASGQPLTFNGHVVQPIGGTFEPPIKGAPPFRKSA